MTGAFETLDVGRRTPFAHLSRVAPFDREWVRIDLAVAFPEDGTGAAGPVILARRVAGDLRTAPRVSYVSAPTCPGLQDVVLEIETLRAPHIDVPGLGRYESDEIVVTGDGPGYRVWGQGSLTNDPVEHGSLEIDVGSAHPVGAWVDRVIAIAASCWRPSLPKP